MKTLTTSERDALAAKLGERKKTMRDEIRSGVAALRGESHADIQASMSDAGDESLAMMVSNLANAEVARDAAELRDILAAEARIAAGTYGQCIDCEKPIPYARLDAYPTAKRCIGCQEVREAERAR